MQEKIKTNTMHVYLLNPVRERKEPHPPPAPADLAIVRDVGVAYWAPTDLGSSSFIVLTFCLFILFMGFSRQEY